MTENNDPNNQLDIFSGFMTNSPATPAGKEQNLTNLTGLYSQMAKRISKPRGASYKEGDPKLVYRTFKEGNQKVDYSISPAMIPTKAKDGSKSSEVRYCGVREDRVEEALAYIASQGSAHFDPDRNIIGVFFTLGGLKAEVHNLFRKKMSHAQIKEALQVLSRTAIDITGESSGTIAESVSTRISNLKLISREDYERNPFSRCYCELHWAFARDIMTNNFCAHDLEWQGRLDDELAQDLMRRLSFKYRHANLKNSYHFMGREFLENSFLGFDEKYSRKRWASLREALEALEHEKVISRHELTVKTEGHGGRPTIVDYKVEVWPTKEFIASTKFRNWFDSERRAMVNHLNGESLTIPEPTLEAVDLDDDIWP